MQEDRQVVALVAMLAASIAAEPWYPANDVIAVLDVIDRPGVAIHRESGQVDVLDVNGKIVASVPEVNGNPLYYSFEHGLRVASFNLFADYRNGAAAPTSIGWKVFGQHGATFLLHSQLHVFGKGADFVIPGYFDRFSVAGIRRDGKKIAFIHTPIGLSVLGTAAFVDEEWRPGQIWLTPEVEHVGFPVVVQGLNGLRFLSDEVVCYVGTIRPLAGSPEQAKKFEETLKKLPLIKVQRTERPSFQVQLFATSLRSHLTYPLLQLEVDASSHYRGPDFGLMSLSFDGTWLYMVSANGVEQLRVSELLETFERLRALP
jgi:hypothetical protein